MSEEAQAAALKAPSLFRNYLSLIGAAIAVASFTSTVLLFLIDLTAGTNNPYLGIFAYILFPAILIFGLSIVLAGMLIERRRRRRLSPTEMPSYPTLDLNDPRRRRAFFVFLGFAFLFICFSAFGSYRAYEYTESVEFCGQACHTVMKPEFVAHKASPHARVRCVECHVGPGAGGYVQSKFTGAYQLYSVTFNKYPKPITTPVHNMPAEQGTCAQCHWPEKFHGDQLKVFNHYSYDQTNTLRRTRMMINVGGGSTEAGPVSGIHWHMNLANEITYIATDAKRQVIPWVRLKDRQGNVTEYTAKDAQLTPELVAKAEKRRMNCIDCHNRPTHIYVPPDEAVDASLSAGKLDVELPYLKRQAVEALSKPYATTGEALNSIASNLDQFYRANYADTYTAKADSIKRATAEIQRIYETYFFPEMKTDWQAHPNNIGHYYSQGCFRCHDNQHTSSTGKVISNYCNICHTVLDQSEEGTTFAAQNGAFRHTPELGDLAGRKCTDCHKGNAGFRHPVNLGDISQFKCVDCHSGKQWSRRPAN